MIARKICLFPPDSFTPAAVLIYTRMLLVVIGFAATRSRIAAEVPKGTHRG